MFRISSRQELLYHFYCLACFCFAHFYGCRAMEIRWKSSTDETDQEPAKTAPKSQRYWDEHNIERPDYAKTDAELGMEQGYSFYTIFGLLGILLGLTVGFYIKMKYPWDGKRLGSVDPYRFHSWTPEEAREKERKARLAILEGKQD